MVNEGDIIRFEPKNGGKYPHGNVEREGKIQSMCGEYVIVILNDGSTRKISKTQIVD